MLLQRLWRFPFDGSNCVQVVGSSDRRRRRWWRDIEPIIGPLELEAIVRQGLDSEGSRGDLEDVRLVSRRLEMLHE